MRTKEGRRKWERKEGEKERNGIKKEKSIRSGAKEIKNRERK